ncbi:MAG TPA: OFA family MFS transporter [Candidatus Angelobacter sp.]|jgi:MFS family permease|nr:OFA family MFS transporter [Candidatus Angelobacter sp.]
MAAFSFLDRNRSIAKPGFSRWLVPPAALSIHLAIGQAYAFSVFKKPLNYLVQVSTVGGGLKALPGVDSPNLADWKFTDLGWIFSIAIVFLGLSAAIFGKWLEKAGPRKAMFASAVCFASGFFVSAIGVHFHQLWLIYLGYGVIGGIGLGLGYISPVSTLIKWFPDRPGMATGMAIMGFGGGAMIGAPLANNLMAYFHTDHDLGVEKTFLVMGAIYFVAMMFGVFTVRVPEAGWKPAGWVAPAKPKALVTSHSVEVNTAFGTPQFWLLWIVLCMNVTAGIGILEQASPMIQELFKGRITAAAAGGFVALLSLFNMGGRFFWSSISDYIGRKNTYFIFFVLGGILYYLAPHAGVSGWNSIPLFVGICAVILTMYGGGFATIPAYLRDLFGTMEVGAIHGRLLTAWSVAGVLGPVLVNYIREYEKNHGVPLADAYSTVLYVMVGLLMVGLIANSLVKPVNSKYWYSTAEDVNKKLATA